MNKNEIKLLPKEVIKEAKGTLRAYDSVQVIYEDGQYKVMTGYLLRHEYPEDFKVIGTIHSKDVYSEKEMIVNYIEEFLSYPAEYNGKKDWNMIKELKAIRLNRKQAKISLDKEGNAFIKKIINQKGIEK
jgi:hypothetical protein